jgi:hypothetical protein
MELNRHKSGLTFDASIQLRRSALNAKTITSRARSAIDDTVGKLSGMMGLGAKPKRRRRRKSATARVKAAMSRTKTAAGRKTARIKRRVKSAAKGARNVVVSRPRRATARR